MIRLFETNQIRKVQELSGSLWTFSPCSGEWEGKEYPVVVPCCWESLPDFAAYRGVGRFFREFQAEGTVRLVFQGVSHTARVLVDGREVGTHYNAYTPFSLLVENLAPGSHRLEVYADNRFSEESALHVPNDYMSYGGISRGVTLEVEYLHAVPVKAADGWHLRLSVKLQSTAAHDQKAELTVKLGEQICFRREVMFPAGQSLLVEEDWRAGESWRAGENGQAGENWQAGEKWPTGENGQAGERVIQEWSPESPVLYPVTAILSRDDVPFDDLTEQTGFREIRTEGKDILLNGKKLRIKGFCRHEDHPMYGCALPLAAMEQDLQIMKDLGANAVRTVHYPNDPLFLDLCDQQGFLVWEENHARGLSLEQMENPHFQEQAEACIQEMITAHINHPSIIIWGILNECASDTEYGRDCYERQYDLIHSLDVSRPRSSASCKWKTDLCLGFPEIISYNIYPEWYHDEKTGPYLQDLYQWVQEKSEGSGRPFLITEIGAGAIYGYRTPTLCKWSEEYQAQALEHQIKAVFEQEGCSGLFIWQFCDVRISFEWFSTRPRTMNNKGVVDEYRRRKLAYDKVKELYHSYGNYR